MVSLAASIDDLLDRLVRQLTARADREQQVELIAAKVGEARRRYHALDPARRQEARRAARRLLGLRERVASLTGAPACCAGCARRLANATRQPAPLLAGGHCCGGDPEKIFDELEVAALWLAGRVPSRRRMILHRSGCFYRGADGCLLPPVDRPSICARYLCSDLVEEMSRSGALTDLMDSSDALEVEMARIGHLLGLTPTAI